MATQRETEIWPLRADAPYAPSEETLVAPPPNPFPPPPPDRRIAAGMLLALAAVVLAGAGVAAAWLVAHRTAAPQPQATTVVVTTGGRTAASVVARRVAMPRLVGLEESRALMRLAHLGLRPTVLRRKTVRPTGTVVAQKPRAARRIRRGTRVTLVIDTGLPLLAVPQLVGEPWATAQARLRALGFQSVRTSATSDQPAGSVVDQAPRAGAKLAKGSEVTLSVAAPRTSATQQPTTAGGAATTAPGATAAATTAGPATTATKAAPPPQPVDATVPDVGGQREQAAVQALGRAGILASLFFVPSRDALGTVEQQAKPVGTTLPYHAHVQINISQGPGQKEVETMPDVIGKTLSQALTAVNGAHLRLIYLKLPITSRAQAGTIVQQSPLGGGHVPENAQVLVFLGAYRPGGAGSS